MVVYLENKEYFYETEKVIRLFLPFEKIHFNSGEDNGRVLRTNITKESCAALLLIDGRTVSRQETITGGGCELCLVTAVFRCFVEISGYKPSWGMLTGIRPARLFNRIAAQKGEEGAERVFSDRYFVDENKLSLLRETSASEQDIIKKSKNNSVSLYVSVPFCPSRCSYCSFVSEATERSADLMPEYVDRLCEEISATAEYVSELGLRLETVYMGGGTPTTLAPALIERVLGHICQSFDMKTVREFTVEAGRPDTVDADKLKAIKPFADRICINPQSLSDDVLQACGRRHTAAQFYEAFSAARRAGFNNINCDIIAGLPLETAESFCDTVKKISALSPEGVTVHALSLKRAANFYKDAYYEFMEGKTAAGMVEGAYDLLTAAGYRPYYLYRQSKTIGNLENVGYSKPGFLGIYNVYIMDETHTILGVGAGAVTKLRRPFKNEIERIFNFKFPYEYIRNFPEILRRKQRIGEFYNADRVENK